uniref:Efflux transporter, RND family, MFP subunit n=1 Tax=Caulobacter sp. (strain K31) TaxID=366602 RepID=B0T0M5_CAUSK
MITINSVRRRPWQDEGPPSLDRHAMIDAPLSSQRQAPTTGRATALAAAARPETPSRVPSTAPAPRAAARPVWVWLAIAAMAVAALVGGAVLLRPPTIVPAAVTSGEAVDVVYASGVVEYVRQAHVAPVTTAPIRQVAVAEGERVVAGQLLAQLEDGPSQGTALQLAAQAVQARVTADRTRRLFDAGFAAKAADDDAQAQARAAEAAAQSARARLRDYRLTAPFAGRILRRDAEPGDLASAGATLFLLADTKAVRVTADVDERDIAKLKPGAQALIRADAFAGRVFTGQIAQITPAGDATGRVFRVRIALPPGGALAPGMTVETNLVAERRAHAILAPASAVSDGAVWRIAKGRAYRTPVRVGAASAARVEIVSGLSAGDVVVAAPSKTLRDRQRVRLAASR